MKLTDEYLRRIAEALEELNERYKEAGPKETIFGNTTFVKGPRRVVVEDAPYVFNQDKKDLYFRKIFKVPETDVAALEAMAEDAIRHYETVSFITENKVLLRTQNISLIHAGEMAVEIARMFNGNGGGTPTKAIITIPKATDYTAIQLAETIYSYLAN